jgi:hypothetical protein
MARGFRIAALTCELAWALTLLLMGSDAGLTLWALLLLMWGGPAVAIVAIIRLAVGLARPHAAFRGRSVRVFAAEVAVLALLACSVWSGLAFRARFVMSLPWLKAYVATVTTSHSSGAGVVVPRIVGLFRVREVEVLPEGAVRLITTECMLDHCGIVYSPARRPPVVGEDAYARLPFGWWQWWRSW